MRTPESYEKEDIKKYLDKGSPFIWYFPTYMAGYGASGIPDIVGCKATIIKPEMVSTKVGLWFSTEVKRPGKVPSIKQDKRMKEIGMAGGKTFWGDAEKVIGEFEAWIA